MDKNSKIFVTHHHDMIGGGIVRALERKGYKNIICRTIEELDLTSEEQTQHFFAEENPEYVFCFAGPHGGIIANITYPVDLMLTNLKIQNNIFYYSHKYGVKKLLFMAGACVYPRECKQPMQEDSFMDGKMEPTSEAYSTARAAGIVMCGAFNKQYKTNFVPAILTNYYGVGDDFSENGHVLASVIKKMYNAMQKSEERLMLWGTGTPKRQFMYIDDMADAAVLVMEKYHTNDLINIAGGTELSICEMAEKIKAIIKYRGEIVFDSSKPDGAMRKLSAHDKLDSLGFKESYSFEMGLQKTYEYYLGSISEG